MSRIEKRSRRLRLRPAPAARAGLRAALVVAGIATTLLSGAAAAATCTVAPVVAPVFAPYQSTTRDATGSITVTCSVLVAESVSYNIRLGLGGQAVGTQRQMVSSGSLLRYNLFCTNGFSQVWADGLGGTCAPTGRAQVPVALPLVSTYTVYGRIPAGQFVAAGTYLDTVTITVLY